MDFCALMIALPLKFRLEMLSQEGRAFKGELSQATVADTVDGLVGKFGYRAQGPAQVEGVAYRSSADEVIITGRFTVQLGFDCVRCLAENMKTYASQVDHVLVKKTKIKVPDGDEELIIDETDEDPDVYRFTGDEIDLNDVFREDILLELPMNPTCTNDVPCSPPKSILDDPAAKIDPRWAPLLEMKKQMN